MSRNLKPIVPGEVRAEILRLDDPISFWGGIDQDSGRIIDKSHPQEGHSVAGTCLVVPMVRGSGGTPGSLAMLLKLGRGPAGIVIGYPDMNVLSGIVVANRLYRSNCPLFLADQRQLDHFTSGAFAQIQEAGHYFLEEAPTVA